MRNCALNKHKNLLKKNYRNQNLLLTTETPNGKLQFDRKKTEKVIKFLPWKFLLWAYVNKKDELGYL